MYTRSGWTVECGDITSSIFGLVISCSFLFTFDGFALDCRRMNGRAKNHHLNFIFASFFGCHRIYLSHKAQNSANTIVLTRNVHARAHRSADRRRNSFRIQIYA